MEGAIDEWNNSEAEKKVAEEEDQEALQRKRVLQRSTTKTSSDNHKDDIQGVYLDLNKSEKTEKLEVITRQVKIESIDKSTILGASYPPPMIIHDGEGSTSLTNNVRSEIRTIGTVKENEEGRQELYLERVYQKPTTHGFYCPKCKACIQTVYILKGELEEWEQKQQPSAPANKPMQPKPIEPIRCTSCFSFLVPIGSWLFPCLKSEVKGAPNDQGHGSNIPAKNNIASQDPSNNSNETSQDHRKRDQTAPKKKKPFWSNLPFIGGGSSDAPHTDKPKPSPDEIDIPAEEKPDHVKVTVDNGSTGQSEEPAISDASTPLVPSGEASPPMATSSKRLEILKSIVYGGLTESLASLSVVTSAASVNATALNIVALAMANLVGGLFVLGNNLRELKAEKPKESENQTTATVDRYNDLLGQRENSILHTFISILSFIVFGLVPPIVYGFSFQESDEKDYKLAAIAVSSLFCITLLSIAKAHIQRPTSYMTYFQTVVYYVTTGAMASVISYLAGQFVNKMLEKLGWFEPTTLNFALQGNGHGHGMVQDSAWSSY